MLLNPNGDEPVVFDGRLVARSLVLLDIDWPTTGPCGRCQNPTTRYGEAGHVLCDACRDAPSQPNPERKTP